MFKNLLIAFVLTLFTMLAYAEPVDINTATAEELQSLKGIGEKKAMAIIEYRQENGPFTSIEGLTEVKGIGAKLLENNKGNLAVGKSPPKKTEVKKTEAKKTEVKKTEDKKSTTTTQ